MDFLLDKNGEPSLVRIGMFFLVIILACTAVSVAIDAAFWGGKVILAPFIGQGDTRIQVESKENRIAAQKKFVSLYADVQKYQSMAAAADKDIIDYNAETEGKADPSGAIAAEKARLKQIKTGIQNTCRLAVANYNAAAVSITEAQFRPENLPASIALTSCEVNK